MECLSTLRGARTGGAEEDGEGREDLMGCNVKTFSSVAFSVSGPAALGEDWDSSAR